MKESREEINAIDLEQTNIRIAEEEPVLDGAFAFSAIVQGNECSYTLTFIDALPEGKQWYISGIMPDTSLEACIQWLIDNGHIPSCCGEPLRSRILADLEEALEEEKEIE